MKNFTYDWFGHVQGYWDVIFNNFRFKNILEIGSFEGRSTCYIIDQCTKYNPIDLYCIDTWEGSVEHRDMQELSTFEYTFHKNINESIRMAQNPVSFHKLKGTSAFHLSKLIANGMSQYFDLVYIDGSHTAADVLSDACMAFHLTKVGGTIIFDDYLWDTSLLKDGSNPFNSPKLGIDSFVSTYGNKMQNYVFTDDPNKETYQKYFLKISN